ncbi:MAG TPA: dTDP-4-dehydrorhamnose 3,5-epimerase [Clostridia bacterium]|nr:dTDP-4-dehydrorhamnose 3,5-epimerase [Clostridia bacterium]
MERIELDIPGVYLFKPRVFTDDRGFFFESYRQVEFSEMGVTHAFVQDNHSRSARGTIRALHYQLVFPQAKLCRVVHGEVFDVAVDIRVGSPSFGRWVGAILSAENKQQLYIPEGFAHGFSVLSESAEFLYKCSEYYHAEDDHGIAWNDPSLHIDWHLQDPILSAKDRLYPRLDRTPKELLPSYR